jgi:hypothetical protein
MAAAGRSAGADRRPHAATAVRASDLPPIPLDAPQAARRLARVPIADLPALATRAEELRRAAGATEHPTHRSHTAAAAPAGHGVGHMAAAPATLTAAPDTAHVAQTAAPAWPIAAPSGRIAAPAVTPAMPSTATASTSATPTATAGRPVATPAATASRSVATPATPAATASRPTTPTATTGQPIATPTTPTATTGQPIATPTTPMAARGPRSAPRTTTSTTLARTPAPATPRSSEDVDAAALARLTGGTLTDTGTGQSSVSFIGRATAPSQGAAPPSSPETTSLTSPPAAISIDHDQRPLLIEEIYDRIVKRLRRELLDDRERRGRLIGEGRW